MTNPRPQLVAVGSQGWAEQKQIRSLARRRVIALCALVAIAGTIGFLLGNL